MLYRFDDCELDVGRRELRRSGVLRSIEPQVFDLLLFLVQNSDRLVSKAELIKAVWSGRFVSDAALSSRIMAARRAIGDTGASQRLIRTVHSRGFRFIGDLSEARPDERDAALSPEPSGATAPGPREPALAVLPLENLSGEQDQQYFADGVAEDIISALTAWRYLPIIGRGASFAYRHREAAHVDVARELGARYLLTGSVRKSGRRLRVSLQLLDGGNGHQIWSGAYDQIMKDIFDIQDDIARRVAAAIIPELERHEAALSLAKTDDALDAWDYFHRGAALLSEFTRDGNRRARAMFQRAIERDPRYGKAFTGLAYTCHRDLFWAFAPDRAKWRRDCLEAAEAAVRLDGRDAVARNVLAYGRLWRGDHDLAVAEAREAVKLNPGNAFSRIVLGDVLDASGARGEALDSAKLGVELNERNPRVQTFLGVVARILLSARAYAEAEAWARKALTVRSDYPHAQVYCAVALAYQDRVEEARRLLSACAHQPVGIALRYRDPEDSRHMRDGLEMVGWREPKPGAG